MICRLTIEVQCSQPLMETFIRALHHHLGQQNRKTATWGMRKCFLTSKHDRKIQTRRRDDRKSGKTSWPREKKTSSGRKMEIVVVKTETNCVGMWKLIEANQISAPCQAPQIFADDP